VALTDEELAAFKKQTRTGRPSGAWIEKVDQCSRCGAQEAEVTWFGEGFRVGVQTENGEVRVDWPKRTGERSGPSGMRM
jgi:hypothetical protein